MSVRIETHTEPSPPPPPAPRSRLGPNSKPAPRAQKWLAPALVESNETAVDEGECFNMLLSLCFPPSVEHGGVWRLKPDLKKCRCLFSLIPHNTH
jgi:hypothetical protein